MAWRSYVDPSDNQVWWTDDAGNFIPGSQFQPPSGGSSGGGGGGQQYAGGGYGLSDAAAAQQLALLLRRLEEVEIPGLGVQQKQMLINALSQMQQSSGYINPGLWQQILGATGGGGTGGGAGLTSEAALDWIAERRPDVLDFHKQNGWDVSTPAAKRAAVQNWIGQVDPQWSGKTPQAVAAELGYQGTTGGGAGAGTAGPGVYQQMIDWYKSRADAGQTPTQDQWVQRLVQLTGITPEQANLMYQRGREYQAVTGQGRPSEAEWSGWLNQIAPQKTLDRERYEGTLAEQQRQFDLAQKQQGQQFWGGLLASKSGPRDYWTANMLQASMPENVKWGDMQSLVRNTPSFGAMTPSDSWESTFKNWVEQQKGGGAEAKPTPGQARFDGGPSGGGAPDNSGDWEYITFPDASLGKPQPGQVYAQVLTPGWRNKKTGETRAGDFPSAPPGWQRVAFGRASQGAPPAMPSRMGAPGDTYDIARYDASGRMLPPTQAKPPVAAGQQDATWQAVLQGATPSRMGAPGDTYDIAPQGGQRPPFAPPQPQGGPTTEPVDWRGKFQQPNQLDPRTYGKMGPSQREMLAGQYSAYGIDPNDAFNVMKRSWNTGGGGISGRKSWR